MKISRGLKEDGVVAGNNFDKYGSKNPIVKKIMRGFDESLYSLVESVSPSTIHEVGCGEGFWVINWLRKGITVHGSDFSSYIIDIAKENACAAGEDPSVFSVKSIYDLDENTDKAELIICCEVLEHLDNPRAGLEALRRITSSHIILSVPREPLWCGLNLARGKYITNLGNTPGHIQHWTKKMFLILVSNYFSIIDIRSPIPWTMVLAQAKS